MISYTDLAAADAQVCQLLNLPLVALTVPVAT
jgi:hypothetical protein